MRSGVSTAAETVGDYGFVHNLAHEALFTNGQPGFITNTVDYIRHVESLIPGLWMPGF
ncbi:MAG: hypothetical protein OXH68_20970 [Gammaproteobacteria bacterium]|nr:hypothetical protein [Gammaproteobacteria bacterium]